MPDAGRHLLIFDVDGTLLLNGRVTRDAFAAAFQDVCGVPAQPDALPFAGMTDRGIFRALLRRAGQDPDGDGAGGAGSAFDALFTRFARRFADILAEVYPTAEGPYLLPGVLTLVQTLTRRADVALALGTGNIRETAYIKLRRFGLEPHFPVGGFGGDHEQRADVIRAALHQARHHYGIDGAPDAAWVIGDTRNDVAAARAAGTRALAVGSGFTPLTELRASGADVVLTDLADTASVLAALRLA
jgi:phosphoglycolate phosphatase